MALCASIRDAPRRRRSWRAVGLPLAWAAAKPRHPARGRSRSDPAARRAGGSNPRRRLRNGHRRLQARPRSPRRRCQGAGTISVAASAGLLFLTPKHAHPRHRLRRGNARGHLPSADRVASEIGRQLGPVHRQERISSQGRSVRQLLIATTALATHATRPCTEMRGRSGERRRHERRKSLQKGPIRGNRERARKLQILDRTRRSPVRVRLAPGGWDS
jgi:hypothetical protein